MLASHRLKEEVTIRPGTPEEAVLRAEISPLGAGLREGEGGMLSVVRRYRIRARRDEIAPAHGLSLLWQGRLLTVTAHAIAADDRRLVEIEAEETLA